MKNYCKKRNYSTGFTLIEILIAIFILSLGIYAVIVMFPLGIKVMKASQMTTQAAELAQEKIEETVSLAYSLINVGVVLENPLPAPFENFRRETIISYVDPESGLSETEIDKGIKKITVKVYWKSLLGINEKSLEIVTLFSKR